MFVIYSLRGATIIVRILKLLGTCLNICANVMYLNLKWVFILYIKCANFYLQKFSLVLLQLQIVFGKIPVAFLQRVCL